MYGYKDHKYQVEDEVLFKQELINKWQGPTEETEVIENKAIVIFCGHDRTVHLCRATPDRKVTSIIDKKDMATKDTNNKEDPNNELEETQIIENYGVNNKESNYDIEEESVKNYIMTIPVKEHNRPEVVFD